MCLSDTPWTGNRNTKGRIRKLSLRWRREQFSCVSRRDKTRAAALCVGRDPLADSRYVFCISVPRSQVDRHTTAALSPPSPPTSPPPPSYLPHHPPLLPLPLTSLGWSPRRGKTWIKWMQHLLLWTRPFNRGEEEIHNVAAVRQHVLGSNAKAR